MNRHPLKRTTLLWHSHVSFKKVEFEKNLHIKLLAFNQGSLKQNIGISTTGPKGTDCVERNVWNWMSSGLCIHIHTNPSMTEDI